MRESSFLSVALRADIVRRSARVAFIVGTLLALINHGDSLLQGCRPRGPGAME